MGHIFLSCLFFNLILIILYSHYKRGGYYVKKKDLILYTILFIAFGTYGGGEGDYFHYQELVEEFNTFEDVLFFTGMEKQYVFLSYIVGGDYTLWRFILYSIQFIGFSFLLYKANLNTYPVLLSFTSFCLVTSVYGRSFWGIIYFFLGIYSLIEKKNPFYLLAIVLCYLSHMSEIILLALSPLAFINIKKWHFLLIVVVFGSLVAIFKDTFTNLLNTGGIDADGADYLNGRLQHYGNAHSAGNFGNSIGERISMILRDSFVITILFTPVRLIFKSHNGYLSIYKPVRGIINISIGLIITALVVLAASVGSGTIFYRIFDMTFFPVSIILPCLWCSKFISKRRFDLYIYLFIFYSEYGYLKDLYYAYANGIY